MSETWSGDVVRWFLLNGARLTREERSTDGTPTKGFSRNSKSDDYVAGHERSEEQSSGAQFGGFRPNDNAQDVPGVGIRLKCSCTIVLICVYKKTVSIVFNRFT